MHVSIERLLVGNFEVGLSLGGKCPMRYVDDTSRETVFQVTYLATLRDLMSLAMSGEVIAIMVFTRQLRFQVELAQCCQAYRAMSGNIASLQLTSQDICPLVFPWFNV